VRLAGVVLAAGAGSRLAPLTDFMAKPLLPVLDRTLLDHQLDRLAAVGVEAIFVNLHHHADQVAAHLAGRSGPPIVHRTEPRLTGPAGALALFAGELGAFEAVVVASGDVLLGAAPERVVQTHVRGGAALTFGSWQTTCARRFGVLDVDADGGVWRTREKPAVPDSERRWVSAGVYCLAPTVVQRIADAIARGATLDYASDVAPELLARRKTVLACPLEGYWRDVGTPEALLAANFDALAGAVPALAGDRDGLQRDASTGRAVFVNPSARVDADTTRWDTVVVAAGARVEAGALLAHTVLLPGAVAHRDAVVVGGLVGGPPQ
jgi:NDP-sugar pyrophosphorylase family protein